MGALGWILGGLATVAAGMALYYYIDKNVEESDIKEYAKKAISTVVSVALKIVITLVSGNTVSFDVMDSTGTKESVNLEGTGVAGNIFEGKTITI